MSFHIYVLTWEGRHERYVGCTKNPEQRLAAHCAPGNASFGVRQMATDFGSPTMTILETVDSVADARQAEETHIADQCAAVGWLGGLNTAEFSGYYKREPRQEQELPPEDAIVSLARRRALAEMLLSSMEERPPVPMPALEREQQQQMAHEREALARRRAIANKLLGFFLKNFSRDVRPSQPASSGGRQSIG